MFRNLPLIAAALVAAAIPISARAVGARARAAQPLPPELLDTLTFNRWMAFYKVNIPNCATFGHRLVRIRLYDIAGSVRIDKLHLTYADRQVQWIPIHRTFRAGEQSSWLDLAVHGYHDSRCLAYLQIGGTSLDSREPARLEVYGISENSSGPSHAGN